MSATLILMAAYLLTHRNRSDMLKTQIHMETDVSEIQQLYMERTMYV